MQTNGRLRSLPDEVVMTPQLASRSVWLNFLAVFIFYSLIVLIPLVAIPYGAVAPWWEAIFECTVFFLGVLWIVHGLWAGSRGLGNASLFYPLIALVLFAALQSLPLWRMDSAGNKVWYSISSDAFESWRFALKTAALALAGILLIRYTTNRQRLSTLVHAIIGVGVACALFGIMRQAMQHSPGFLLPLLKPGLGFAQFINKNHFAYLMEMGIGLAAGVAIVRSGSRERILIYLAALLLMLVALILCNSRGGRLALVAQVVFAPVIFLNVTSAANQTRRSWARSLAIKATVIVSLLLVIIGGAVLIGGDQLATGADTAAIELSGADTSELHEGARRRDIWRASLKMFKAHPLLGAGFGGYWAEVPVFHEASGILTPQQAHNDYLEVLASGGIIGAALMGWFAVAVINQTRKRLITTDGIQRAAVWGASIGLVGVAVHSVVDFGLHTTINAFVFVALLAIVSLNPLSSSTTH
jgi:putative inorganic carbon (hco3(-)) transporter